jgi:hypothetical protein
MKFHSDSIFSSAVQVEFIYLEFFYMETIKIYYKNIKFHLILLNFTQKLDSFIEII